MTGSNLSVTHQRIIANGLMQAEASPFNRYIPVMGTCGQRFCCAKVIKLPIRCFDIYQATLTSTRKAFSV